MKVCPCKGCDKRNPKCHGNCEQYLDWSQGHKARQEELKRIKKNEADYASILVRSFMRMTAR